MSVDTNRGALDADQIEALLRPIKAQRVYQTQGMAHVAAFDVTAHLSRLFGFDGWDKEIVDLSVVHERIIEVPASDPKKPPVQRCWVTYRCVMRLTIRNRCGQVVKVIDEAATGAAQNMPGVGDAHDFAVKNAISYALKRCAKDLGDQFGLSLYNKGSEAALVRVTLVTRGDAETVPDPEAHIEQVEDEGTDPTVDTATDTAAALDVVTSNILRERATAGSGGGVEDPETGAAFEAITEAEIVAEEPAAKPTARKPDTAKKLAEAAAKRAEVKASGKDFLTAGTRMAVEKLKATDHWPALVNRMADEGIPAAVPRMTETQAQQVLNWHTELINNPPVEGAN